MNSIFRSLFSAIDHTPTKAGAGETGSPFLSAYLSFLGWASLGSLVAGLLTYPVLAKTGYGVLPPGQQPALTDATPASVRWRHLGYGLTLGIVSMGAIVLGVPLVLFLLGSPILLRISVLDVLAGIALVIAPLAGYFRLTGVPLRALTGIVAYLSVFGFLAVVWIFIWGP